MIYVVDESRAGLPVTEFEDRITTATRAIWGTIAMWLLRPFLISQLSPSMSR